MVKTMSVLFALTLVALSVRADPPPSTSTPLKTFATAFQPLIDNHRMAGAVALIADRERVIHQGAVGYADIATSKLMQIDALFWIASMTKPITATALMILVDEGKVDPDDPVEKYLPEFKSLWVVAEKDDEHQLLRRPKRPLTIRHLLMHTGGMVHFSAQEDLLFATTGKFGQTTLLPLREAVQGYGVTPLQFDPGERWQYSNAGFNTIGRIIEVVSGMPYEEFLKQRLFQPLGMHDTTFSPNKRQLKRLATSYKLNVSLTGLEETKILGIAYPLEGRKNLPWPAGGLFSTANDLMRFCQMLLNGGTYHGKRILSEAAIQRMIGRPANSGDAPLYLLGWFVNGDDTYGHNGAYSTIMTLDPKRGVCKILLQQHAGFPGNGNPIIETFDKVAKEEFHWGER